jgi:hypothetical protein
MMAMVLTPYPGAGRSGGARMLGCKVGDAATALVTDA